MDSDLSKAAQEIDTRLIERESESLGIALDALLVLEKYEPDTARLAIETFEDRNEAALWLTRPVPSLGRRRPWTCLAQGDVDSVRRVLYSIEYGIPP
ncbi:MAG: antitoxin Xre/MbcA/ParS toxin-binding domain-containing protein [Gammaproteobacteria bacterium]